MYIYICNNDILIQFASIFLRLTAYIKEDRTGKISLSDIQSKMGKNISPVGLGRLMVKLYPEVKCKQERLKSEWNKREHVFHGVKWRV